MRTLFCPRSVAFAIARLLQSYNSVGRRLSDSTLNLRSKVSALRLLALLACSLPLTLYLEADLQENVAGQERVPRKPRR